MRRTGERAGVVADAVRVAFGRDATAVEVDEFGASLDAAGPRQFFDTLLSSSEFRDRYFALVREPSDSDRHRQRHEIALRAIDTDEHFLDLVYECCLGRAADPDGRDHYLRALKNGESRLQVLSSILRSNEFDVRFVQLVPFIPRDVQLCELANPAKWDNPDWMAFFRDLRILPLDRKDMHRKGYELTQLLFGLHRLGRIHDDAAILSVGAGHECVLYWLANHVGQVVATDLYEEQWSASRAREGDASVLRNAAAYAPFPYREDRLTFLQMDGRRLAFADGAFDVAYSLSSIEHFGGLDGACAAVDEMARVVKPGGIVVVATEYRLSGPKRAEVFEPAEIQTLFHRPGMRLIESVDEDVYRRYRYMPIDVVRLPYQTPHLVVKVDETVLTSVVGFLEIS
jgi:SAM-dependent methyltransferase